MIRLCISILLDDLTLDGEAAYPTMADTTDSVLGPYRTIVEHLEELRLSYRPIVSISLDSWH